LESKRMELKPVGRVIRVQDDGTATLRIDDEYRDGLRGLEEFSHVWVMWWGHRSSRDVLTVHPLRGRVPRRYGVFATRSPDRPNPILMCLCELLTVYPRSGVLKVRELDALEGSPVLDVKPFIPGYDEPEGDVRTPGWARRARRRPRD